jgi:hypothetical protein
MNVLDSWSRATMPMRMGLTLHESCRETAPLSQIYLRAQERDGLQIAGRATIFGGAPIF